MPIVDRSFLKGSKHIFSVLPGIFLSRNVSYQC